MKANCSKSVRKKCFRLPSARSANSEKPAASPAASSGSAALNLMLRRNFHSSSRKWQQSPPGVRKAEFELYSDDSDDIRSSLDKERLDVGILLEPVETAKYDSLPLSSADRWGVVVRSDSPEAQLHALTQDELVKLPLILPRRHIVINTLHQWFNGGPEPLKNCGLPQPYDKRAHTGESRTGQFALR